MTKLERNLKKIGIKVRAVPVSKYDYIHPKRVGDLAFVSGQEPSRNGETISYAVVKEIGLPDVAVTPVGSGTLAIGVWKDFVELQQMGIISGFPRLVGVQAERINPVARAFEMGLTEVKPVAIGETIATGLVLDNLGVTGTEALRAIRQSEGSVISVPENDVAAMTQVLPPREGIFAEPSGTIGLAGVVLAHKCGQVAAGERAACVITGSGSKDMSVLESTGKEERIFHIPPRSKQYKKLSKNRR